MTQKATEIISAVDDPLEGRDVAFSRLHLQSLQSVSTSNREKAVVLLRNISISSSCLSLVFLLIPLVFLLIPFVLLLIPLVRSSYLYCLQCKKNVGLLVEIVGWENVGLFFSLHFLLNIKQKRKLFFFCSSRVLVPLCGQKHINCIIEKEQKWNNKCLPLSKQLKKTADNDNDKERRWQYKLSLEIEFLDIYLSRLYMISCPLLSICSWVISAPNRIRYWFPVFGGKLVTLSSCDWSCSLCYILFASLVSVSLWNLSQQYSSFQEYLRLKLCHLLTSNFTYVRLMKLLNSDIKWFLCSLTYKWHVLSQNKNRLWARSSAIITVFSAHDWDVRVNRFPFITESPGAYLYMCIVFVFACFPLGASLFKFRLSIHSKSWLRRGGKIVMCLLYVSYTCMNVCSDRICLNIDVRSTETTFM